MIPALIIISIVIISLDVITNTGISCINFGDPRICIIILWNVNVVFFDELLNLMQIPSS